MGSYDELVGLYILFKLRNIDSNLGLYRDDGLGCSCTSKRQTENLKKQIKNTFNELGLKVTIDANMTCVDFLDVTLDLTTGLHKPYMKPNNTLQYVHTSSNHPKHVIGYIRKGVEKRLSLLSSNEEIFIMAIPSTKRPYKRQVTSAF